jgi:hypothetical protein
VEYVVVNMPCLLECRCDGIGMLIFVFKLFDVYVDCSSTKLLSFVQSHKGVVVF